MTTCFRPKVLLRLFSGKSKLFVQPFDILDALLVNIAFVLSLLLFYETTPESKPDGKQSSLLIIALRLWRVFKIVESVIEDSKQKVLQLLNVCEKEKTHCEHKIDILILKVEDLEHEVAYLKEKLKKTERDNSAYVQQLSDSKSKKVNAKRTQSSQSYCPCRSDTNKLTTKQHSMPATVSSQKSCAQISSTLVDIETQFLVSKHSLNETEDTSLDLDVFAKNLAQSITTDVMNAVIEKRIEHSVEALNQCLNESANTITRIQVMQSQSNKRNESPSQSYRQSSPSAKLIDNSVIASKYSSHGLNDSHIYSGLYLIPDQNSHSKSNGSQPNQSKHSSNFDSTSAAHQLNDDSDVERIKRVEFCVNNDRVSCLSSATPLRS